MKKCLIAVLPLFGLLALAPAAGAGNFQHVRVQRFRAPVVFHQRFVAPVAVAPVIVRPAQAFLRVKAAPVVVEHPAAVLGLGVQSYGYGYGYGYGPGVDTLPLGVTGYGCGAGLRLGVGSGYCR